MISRRSINWSSRRPNFIGFLCKMTQKREFEGELFFKIIVPPQVWFFQIGSHILVNMKTFSKYVSNFQEQIEIKETKHISYLVVRYTQFWTYFFLQHGQFISVDFGLVHCGSEPMHKNVHICYSECICIVQLPIQGVCNILWWLNS